MVTGPLRAWYGFFVSKLLGGWQLKDSFDTQVRADKDVVNGAFEVSREVCECRVAGCPGRTWIVEVIDTSQLKAIDLRLKLLSLSIRHLSPWLSQEWCCLFWISQDALITMHREDSRRIGQRVKVTTENNRNIRSMFPDEVL